MQESTLKSLLEPEIFQAQSDSTKAVVLSTLTALKTFLQTTMIIS